MRNKMNNFERLTAGELIDKLKAEILKLDMMEPIAPIAVRYSISDIDSCISDVAVDSEEFASEFDEEKTLEFAKKELSFATAIVDAWVDKRNAEDDYLWNQLGDASEFHDITRSCFQDLLLDNALNIGFVDNMYGDGTDEDDCEDEEDED